MEYLVPAFFLVALAINARAVFKLSLDWKGMRTTVRFVREAYARLLRAAHRGGAGAQPGGAGVPASGARPTRSRTSPAR